MAAYNWSWVAATAASDANFAKHGQSRNKHIPQVAKHACLCMYTWFQNSIHDLNSSQVVIELIQTFIYVYIFVWIMKISNANFLDLNAMN